MFKFRPYQSQGLVDIFGGWSQADILMFILATGGGKTVTFMEPARKYLLSNKRVTVIAHREELIMNAWQTLYDNKIYAGVIMGSRKTNYDLRCQVGSVQTLIRRLKNLPPTDLVIIDEGHHAQEDNSYGTLLKAYFDLNPNLKVLLVTATPYRLSGKGFQWIVPNRETKCIVNRTLHQLQDEGYLVPFRFFIQDIPDLSKMSTSKGDYKEEEAEKAMLKLAPLVDSWLLRAKGLQTIVFAVNIHHSQEIVKQYKARGIVAEHVDGETPGALRLDLFERFKRKEITVLVNVGIATEGVDIPGVECVQLARPTKSLSLAVQMIGRGSRVLSGVIEGMDHLTNEDRKAAISASAKPNCLVLDNAGTLFEHYDIITGKIDWRKYFYGTKNKKQVEEEIEITVFIAEDKDGNKVRTVNAREIVGMELIEVTHENQQKIINIKSLKEFDRLYAVAKNIKQIYKPAITSLNQYFSYCNRNNFFINEECWDYLERVLVDKINDEVLQYEQNCINTLGPNYLLGDSFINSVKRIRKRGMSKAQFNHFKNEYQREGNGGNRVAR